MANKNYWSEPVKDAYIKWWMNKFMGIKNITHGTYAKTCVVVNILIIAGMIYGAKYSDEFKEFGEWVKENTIDRIKK